MKRVGAKEVPPAGYENVWSGGTLLFALPMQVARAWSDEDTARREAARFAAAAMTSLQELAAQRAADAKAAAASPTVRSIMSDAAAPGWHRVLPGLQTLIDAEGDAGHALRAPDSDVRERMAKLRKHLIAKGPDRRIAHPVGWRAALDELEAMMPNFAGPISLLRSSLALGDATSEAVRVPPMLLLGPPGIGKTFFAHQVAKLIGAPSATVAFDQPQGGSALRGLDSHYGNTQTGLLFNLMCLGGACANPVVLLDEIDKSGTGSGVRELDPLAQLHGALEPETARRTVDMSADLIEFDASLVTYIATANTLRGLTPPLLSRMEVFDLFPPDPAEAVGTARVIVDALLSRLKLQGRVRFERKCMYVLAHLSPRLMLRTAEKAVGAAVASGHDEVRESDLWAELDGGSDGPRPH